MDGYVDQSAQSLLLHLVEGGVDENQFTILAVGNTSFPSGLQVKAAIIGASHCIRFSLFGQEWHEVCACVSVHEKGRALVSESLSNVLLPVSLALSDELSYSFSSRQTTWEEGRQEVEGLERVASITKGIGLVYNFPQGEDGITPQTIVTIEWIEGEALIKTAHTYPNEDAIVLTQTNLRRLDR
jgi:hypothetical protein